jgi:hypothetical protein
MSGFVASDHMPYETTVRAFYQGYFPPIMCPKGVEACCAKDAIDTTIKALREQGFKTKLQQTVQLKKHMNTMLKMMLDWHEAHPDQNGKQVDLKDYLNAIWGARGQHLWVVWHMQLATLLFIGGLENDDENGFHFMHLYDPTKPLPAMVAASGKAKK